MNRISIFTVVASTAVGVLLVAMGHFGVAVAVWGALALISQSPKIAARWKLHGLRNAGHQSVSAATSLATPPVMEDVAAPNEVTQGGR